MTGSTTAVCSSSLSRGTIWPAAELEGDSMGSRRPHSHVRQSWSPLPRLRLGHVAVPAYAESARIAASRLCHRQVGPATLGTKPRPCVSFTCGTELTAPERALVPTTTHNDSLRGDILRRQVGPRKRDLPNRLLLGCRWVQKDSPRSSASARAARRSLSANNSMGNNSPIRARVVVGTG